MKYEKNGHTVTLLGNDMIDKADYLESVDGNVDTIVEIVFPDGESVTIAYGMESTGMFRNTDGDFTEKGWEEFAEWALENH